MINEFLFYKKKFSFLKITDDTAVLYYVGRHRYKKLNLSDIWKNIKGFNIIIDKSCNSAIIRDVKYWEKFNFKIIKGSIKIYDPDLKSKTEEYECDGIIHTFSNHYVFRGFRSNRYNRSSYKNEDKVIKMTGLSEPDELAEFYMNTICQFKACKLPKRIPDYISYCRGGVVVSSMYWYGSSSKGSYVIRYSNHWSKISKISSLVTRSYSNARL